MCSIRAGGGFEFIMSMLGRWNTCTSNHIYFTRYYLPSLYQDIHQDQDTPDKQQVRARLNNDGLLCTHAAHRKDLIFIPLYVCAKRLATQRHYPRRILWAARAAPWHVTAVPGVTRLVTCVTVRLSSQLWRNTRQLVAPPIIQGLKEASIFW